MVGGYSTTSAEVVDLRSNSSCILSSYPRQEEGSFGTVLGGEITVCGGSIPGDSHGDECNTYDHVRNRWQRTTPLLSSRHSAAGIMLNNSAWWITGGHFMASNSSTTELKLPNRGASHYIDLPEALWLHQFFKINSTHAILTGGNRLTQSVYMYNIETGKWLSLPDIPENNARFQAGFVTFPNGTRMIIVAGGTEVNFCYGLDLDSLQWTSLPKLPEQIFFATCVQSDFTFYIVGGQHEMTILSSIYEFDVQEEKWVELPQRLNVKRRKQAAMLIPNNLINCDAID